MDAKGIEQISNACKAMATCFLTFFNSFKDPLGQSKATEMALKMTMEIFKPSKEENNDPLKTFLINFETNKKQ